MFLIITVLVWFFYMHIQNKKTDNQVDSNLILATKESDAKKESKVESSEYITDIGGAPRKIDDISSESVNNIKIKRYSLAQPEKSISEFKKHNLIEGCSTIAAILSEHANISSYVQKNSNLGVPTDEARLYRTEKNCREVGLINLSITEIQNLAEKALLHSIKLGNEEAMSKYSIILSNKSYDTRNYNHTERLNFRKEAILILEKLSEKNHVESKLALAYTYSDYVNFPEFFDASKITKLVIDAEKISGENYKNLMDNLLKGK